MSPVIITIIYYSALCGPAIVCFFYSTWWLGWFRRSLNSNKGRYFALSSSSSSYILYSLSLFHHCSSSAMSICVQLIFATYLLPSSPSFLTCQHDLRQLSFFFILFVLIITSSPSPSSSSGPSHYDHVLKIRYSCHSFLFVFCCFPWFLLLLLLFRWENWTCFTHCVMAC